MFRSNEHLAFSCILPAFLSYSLPHLQKLLPAFSYGSHSKCVNLLNSSLTGTSRRFTSFFVSSTTFHLFLGSDGNADIIFDPLAVQLLPVLPRAVRQNRLFPAYRRSWQNDSLRISTVKSNARRRSFFTRLQMRPVHCVVPVAHRRASQIDRRLTCGLKLYLIPFIRDEFRVCDGNPTRAG